MALRLIDFANSRLHTEGRQSDSPVLPVHCLQISVDFEAISVVAMHVSVVALSPKAKCCCICTAVVSMLLMRTQLSCLVGDTFAYKWDSLTMHQSRHALNVRLNDLA